MKTSKSKSPATDEKKEVETFLKNLKHPLKKEIEEVRKIVLSTDKNLTEKIKWNAPSFCHHGEDRITFNLQGKGFFRLIFHCGVKTADKKLNNRLFEDSTGLLEWAANDRAVAKFTDMSDVKSKKQALTETIHAWLKLTNPVDSD